MMTIDVKLKPNSYPIVIGPGALRRLRQFLARHTGKGRVFVFYDAQVFALYARQIRARLKGLKTPGEEMVIPVGEKSKLAAVAARLHDFLLSHEISRSDFILACGGGVTSDLVGYVAATILRGVPWGVVSTTLLGMTDAAIGGKTGINHRRGKNLIGCFWQPSFVLCDSNFLGTLPDRQLIAGLGEVAKYCGLCGNKMLTVMEDLLSGGNLLDKRLLSQLIEMSAGYKARVVTRDERETGPRLFLNLGHTFAHAVEHATGYDRLLHGETVILGLVAAIELSTRMRPVRAKLLMRYGRLIKRMVRLVPCRRIDYERTLTAMRLDKKRIGKTPRLVLLDRPGRPRVADNVSRRMIEQSVQHMLQVYQSEGGRDAPNSGS